jgi:hypothetical protein
VIENVSEKTNKNTNPTYAEVVTCNTKRVSFKEDMKVQNKRIEVYNNNDNTK